MTDEIKGPSGTPESDPVDNQGKDDKVAYDSYRKAVSEKKKAQAYAAEMEARLKEFEQNQRASEEAKLKEEGDLKKLLDLRNQDLERLKEQNTQLANAGESYKKQIDDTWKLQAFFEKLPGTIDNNEYLNFVDIDGIVFKDPETREIDPSSVENTVAKFMEKHGRLVDIRNKKSLPSDAPKSVAPKSFAEMSQEQRSAAMQSAIIANMKRK